METTVKFYSLEYGQAKTYLVAMLFILGNMALPQLCHTVHHDHSPRFHALLDRLVGGKEKLLNKELRSYRAY